MKNKARNISLLAVAAGIVVIPLIRYFWQRSCAMAEAKMDYHPSPEAAKGLFSAYRGSHLPHRRKSGPKNGFPLH